MDTDKYRGYKRVSSTRFERPDVEQFHGLGTSIVVEDIPEGRNPKVLGRIKSGKAEGDWILTVPDGGRQFIQVPSTRLKIGRPHEV